MTADPSARSCCTKAAQINGPERSAEGGDDEVVPVRLRLVTTTETNGARMGEAAVTKGTIAILTGGGDVPGLNPAIRAITIRALREGYRVVGIRRGWAGLVDYERERDADNSENIQDLSEAIVNRAGRTGGTFLHTSRTRPSPLPRERVPRHLSGYGEKIN